MEITSYKSFRANEIKELKKLIKKYGKKAIIYSKTDNWIKIHGIIFNGFSRNYVEELIKEL